MKPKDIFTLAVRVLGLVFLYHCLQVAPLTIAQLYSSLVSLNIASSFTNLVVMGWPMLLAYWLMRGAPLLIRVAYPEQGSRPENEQDVAAAVARKTDA